MVEITKGPAMNVSDADIRAAKSLERHYLMGTTEGEIAERFARHRHEAIEMAAGVIENECDELTFEQRNTAARKVRALAGEGK